MHPPVETVPRVQALARASELGHQTGISHSHLPLQIQHPEFALHTPIRRFRHQRSLILPDENVSKKGNNSRDQRKQWKTTQGARQPFAKNCTVCGL